MTTANEFHVGIHFPSDYLRRADPRTVLTWLSPREVFHPNIRPEVGLICSGHIQPGSGLVDLLYRLFEIITYRRVTMREDDALNWEACQWARGNTTLFPVDSRSLKRRPLTAEVEITQRADPS